MKRFIIIALVMATHGCSKESLENSKNITDTFYVDNAGVSMHVMVEGNISSKILILFVHGGPGEGAFVYNTDYMSEKIEGNYAVAYWDQRNSGSSQGTRNKSNLTISQMIDDMKKVILVIRERYGQDTKVFLLSHSFGGLLCSGFLTTDDNQKYVNGYIGVDGSHDYPKNDTLTREMLMKTGETEITKNNHTSEWNKIIAYCINHPGNFSLDESLELEDYASKAEGYISEVKKVNFVSLVGGRIFKDRLPLTSILANLWSSQQSGLIKEISTISYSSSLNKITIPVLLLYGKYDFICPPELGFDFLSGISSAEKSITISPVSGHNLMFQDEALFGSEVTKFIEKYR